MRKPLHVVSLVFPSTRSTLEELAFFNEISELAAHGIDVYLHLPSRRKQKVPSELNELCKSIRFYVPRKTFCRQFDVPDLIAESAHPLLLKNLLSESAPLLFWGLESAFFLKEPLLKFRQKIVRLSGDGMQVPFQLRARISPIEWRLETMRLNRFSSVLRDAQLILTNQSEAYKRLISRFGNSVWFLPSFFDLERKVSSRKGLYILFAGDFTRRRQVDFALFLIREVFAQIPFNLILASNRPFPKVLIKESSYHYNVSLRRFDNPEQLATHLEKSGISVLNGEDQFIRHCTMYCGGHLLATQACASKLISEIKVHSFQSALQAQALVQKLMSEPLSDAELERRYALLALRFTPSFNGMVYSSLILSPEISEDAHSAFDV
ncbi:MAG: hypothetical protein L6Q78_02515 [Bacteroidia bacterium]|nr:hypothetical protein [Bacteroidia bacterium]